MPWTEAFNNVASGFASIVTPISLVVGGGWVYLRHIREQERYPHIEFSADIEFVGKQCGFWIVELIAYLENKGKVQHKIEMLDFDVSAIMPRDQIETNEKWDGQINFSHAILKGSFLSRKYNFFFLDPLAKAKYSFIARIPEDATFLIFHCWFPYSDERGYSHTAERTVKVPVWDGDPRL